MKALEKNTFSGRRESRSRPLFDSLCEQNSGKYGYFGAVFGFKKECRKSGGGARGPGIELSPRTGSYRSAMDRTHFGLRSTTDRNVPPRNGTSFARASFAVPCLFRVICRHWTAPEACRLCPRKQTLKPFSLTSALGQKATCDGLLDHLVGADE
jgi:hypothetical protein